MPHNLWIGRPGSLREIDQAAKSWDRSADLGATESRAASGRATVVYKPRPVRRLKLSWESLDQRTAVYLDRLARRVDGAGPFVVIDPAAVNLLEAAQAAGRDWPGSGGKVNWFGHGPASTVVESGTAPGAFALQAGAVDSGIGWRHPYWAKIPVAPGMTVSFRSPTAFPLTGVTQLDFKDATGAYLSTATGTAGQVTAVTPTGTAYVTPVAKPGAVGSYSLAGACFTIGGDWPDPTLPGDGCPAMAVTGYSDTPAAKLPYRNISIDFLEVASAAG
ncbi:MULTISPECIES: hypothetical protein [unclassified Kitasatospora]|uniref:hypothetical protein n=1 Tax=unclassified Kitasatospora TaxID=2633591 RepID=UPI00070EDE95|nr:MULTISPECIES: hypothetical protein [unclassified Kitasatospora]KQV18646.1 hypothetical protein ASC99_05370 [Kitasatospora sp. Root107]KRB74628.1 hypothetical protein ASE03_19305 [Kitasatospora sp. Root187]